MFAFICNFKSNVHRDSHFVASDYCTKMTLFSYLINTLLSSSYPH